MSPAAKSKSKDILAAKAAKEQAKVSSKPSVALLSYGNGAPSNAYNPDSGSFRNFDATAFSSLPMSQHNSRFGTIDETEENSVSSFGTTADLDSLSNQGELEELEKKTTTSSTTRLESASCCDTDKREKIRQKNEKKHQRQKERRAQELHERCSGYLMSRKLEMLAQKIVAMGFSSEEATMALIQNEGRVEEAIAWLLELSEESKQQIAANGDGAVNMKIDISMELARITEMEMRFKCTKQEVERAVVASEGDLDKADEILKAQKQVCRGASKSEETGDPVTASSLESKLPMPGAVPNAALKPQQKGLISVGTQQKRDERDLNYIKSVATGVVESPNKNFQSLRKVQPKSEWAKPQGAAPVDKRWSSASSSPSISYPLPSPLQVAIAPINGYAMASNDLKANLPSVALREPVVVMQCPQSVNAKQNPVSTSLDINVSSPASTVWYPNGISTIEVRKVGNGVGPGHSLSHLGMKGSTAQQFASLSHFRNVASSTVESLASGWGGSWNSTVSSASSLTAPSSLGLFTGSGSSGSASSSLLDWSSGGSTPCDYTSIDWSLDTTLLRSSVKSDRLSSTWSTMFMGRKSTRPIVNTAGGICISSLQDSSLAADPSYSSGSHEWSSPFAGRDLFSVPRHCINSSF